MVLLVNEGVLLPVLMPLAPAATLAERFPEALHGVFEALGFVPAFIEAEISALESELQRISRDGFKHLGEDYRDYRGIDDLVTLTVELARTPCGPLYDRHVSPDRELDARVARWSAP